MTEVVAAVASGAGIASLAIQLGDSAIRLRKLYQATKHAPKQLSNLAFEIETCGLLLQEVELRNRFRTTLGPC